MSHEQGENINTPKIERYVQEVLDYLGDATVDSVKGQAYLDQTELYAVDEQRRVILSNMRENPELQSDIFYLSDLRIAEAREALIQHTVERKMLNPQYKEAYGVLEDKLDVLSQEISDTAEEIYSDDDGINKDEESEEYKRALKTRMQYWEKTRDTYFQRFSQTLVNNSTS